MESRGLRICDLRGVRLEGGNHFSRSELLHLLRGAADKGTGVEEAVQFRDDRVEEGGAANALEQVVVLALLLDVVGGLVGEDTYTRLIRWKAGNGRGMSLTDLLVGVLP